MKVRVGDMVLWHRYPDDPIRVKVVGITETAPDDRKDGWPVEETEWVNLHRIILDLDNGHWTLATRVSLIQGDTHG